MLVHPHHGIVVLEATETRWVEGREQRYVVLSVGSLKILAPHEALREIGVRHPMGKTRARRVLRTLTSTPSPVPPFSSREHRELRRTVHSGDPEAVARVLRDLAAKEADRKGGGRGLSASERELLEQATQILASELAVALPTTHEQATARIARAISGMQPDGRTTD